jgi:hypothetical protein
MKTKNFDCVEMKRRGAKLVRQRLAGMTREQEIEYWRQRSEQFQRDQERLVAQEKATPATATTRKP